MNKNILASILGGLTLAALAPALAADNAGGELVRKNSLRLGYYFVTYDVKGSDLTGPFTPAGLRSDLKNVQTPYVAYVRRWTPHVHMEVAFGVPPKTTAVGKGPAFLGSVPFNGQEVLTARWFSPTVLFNWVFRDESAALRPYVGIGINHTSFYERRTTPSGEAIIGGPTSVDLSSSTGLAATVGISYHIQGAWNVYASYSASNVVSDLRTTTAGIVRKSHIDFNPRAIVVSVGYSF